MGLRKSDGNQQEMVQVYQNEFVFGKGGGRGTAVRSAPSLLRTLSSFKDKSKKSVVADDIKVVGAAFSHLGLGNDSPHSDQYSPGTLSKKTRKSKIKARTSPSLTPRNSDQYADLDDDWDADVAQGLASVDAQPKSIENRPLRPSFEYPKIAPPQTDSNGVKDHVDSILRDPANSLYTVHVPKVNQEYESIKKAEELNAVVSRFNRFKKVIQMPNVDLSTLKKMAWNGIPTELRSISWQLLLGYLPTNSDRRGAQLSRKRQEYLDGLNQLFYIENREPGTWHQIKIDVPRTNPHIKLYGFDATQRSLERILYLWAIRHPASGYVQGINDLTTPFFQTFLSSYLEEDADVENFDPKNLPKNVLDAIEADTFWCLTKLLEGIQDNYIHAQPGIIRQVNDLKDLINRIDIDLYEHFKDENVEFIQFSFRWMNCLLMREVSVKNTIRMWDTYLSETNGFSEFHIYVCAAFLVKWSDELKRMEFQDIMMFLQNPPTKDWTEKDIELLLSEAFIWQSLYKNAAAHLRV